MTTQNTTPSSKIYCPVCNIETTTSYISSSINDPELEHIHYCNSPGGILHFSITYREYVTGIHIIAFELHEQEHITLHHLKGMHYAGKDDAYMFNIKPNKHMIELHKNLDIKGLCQYARDYHKMKAFL